MLGGPHRGPGFVRAGPIGRERTLQGRTLRAAATKRGPPATLFPRLFSRSLARQRPPFVICHSSLRAGYCPRWGGPGFVRAGPMGRERTLQGCALRAAATKRGPPTTGDGRRATLGAGFVQGGDATKRGLFRIGVPHARPKRNAHGTPLGLIPFPRPRGAQSSDSQPMSLRNHLPIFPVTIQNTMKMPMRTGNPMRAFSMCSLSKTISHAR